MKLFLSPGDQCMSWGNLVSVVFEKFTGECQKDSDLLPAHDIKRVVFQGSFYAYLIATIKPDIFSKT